MKRAIIIGAAVVVLGGAWAAFRPELLFIDKTVNESFPTSTGGASTMKKDAVLAQGMFTGYAHDTKGTATIHELDGGKRVLRLTNFETSNGPDVRVLLIAADNAMDDATVKNAQPIELGSLKGNIGDQNYDVPTNVDLNKYRAVTIWCNRFSVNFGTAPLALGSASNMAMNDAQPTQLKSGAFVGHAHETKGTATIFQLADGQRVLRLTNFETSNGPDVRVLLISANDAMDDATVKDADRIELGSLKGNIGDQNYDIPANVDLAKYHAVTIWCNRFSVNFATAPLG